MSRQARRDAVVSDPRFLYSHSPTDRPAGTRYVFREGERSPEITAPTLTSAYEWVLDNPPTARDHEEN